MDMEKEALLKARREKLSKWKRQKADYDAQKQKQPSTNQEHPVITKIDNNNFTNSVNSNDKFIERKSKLEEWKRKKRERVDHIEEPNIEIPKDQKLKKKGKNKRKKLSFDEEDNETSEQTIHLFKPNINTDKSQIPNKNLEDVSSTDIDPLDELMKNLNDTEIIKNNVPLSNDILDFDSENLLEDQESDIENESNSKFKKIAKMKALRKVTEVNYSLNDLEPFQKVFYNELEEVKNMTAEEVTELRLNLDNIKIKGKDCPNPVVRWSQLGLNSFIMNLVSNELKFEQLTPIQAQALPAIMSGRDVIGISKTGSGKTISYLLPLIRQIKAQRDLSVDETGPLGLILAPTRELAVQINEEAEKFIAGDKTLNCICCTGGSELKKQINEIKRGVKIIVATPGRFIDLLTLNSGKLVNTKRITFVVIDEADRLFDMGFEPQITQIMKAIRPDKQCVLFSATFPNKLKSFAMRVLKKPLSITINSSNMVNEKVEQSFIICDQPDEKFSLLLSLLKSERQKTEAVKDSSNEDNQEDNKTIIFVASQNICDFVEKQLKHNGIDIFSIHAGKQYHERIINLEKFKTTKNSILLCTEVMSRGLNVPEVSLVIIFNAIKTFAQYVHTTGRTARGDHHGKAISILERIDLASAYIISRAIHPHQLESHDPIQVEMLTKMSEEFANGMSNGKYKLSTGFGGKGLDNLDTKREEKETMQRKQYESNMGDSVSKTNDTKKSEPNENVTLNENKIILPKLTYEILKDTTIDHSVTYSARVNVNDLPQLIRWEATKNTTLMFVKNETGCSVTNKGKYYPPGDGPKTEKDQPKLYLLIEGQNEKDIRLSIGLLEEKVKEGIKKVEYQTIRSTKF